MDGPADRRACLRNGLYSNLKITAGRNPNAVAEDNETCLPALALLPVFDAVEELRLYQRRPPCSLVSTRAASRVELVPFHCGTARVTKNLDFDYFTSRCLPEAAAIGRYFFRLPTF